METNKNHGTNEEDFPPSNDATQQPGNVEPQKAQSGEEEFNQDPYNSEFDERDQKQNIGQKGDTFPPDDPTPTDEEPSNFHRITEDENTENPSALANWERENEVTEESPDLNREETVASINNPNSRDHPGADDIDASDDIIEDVHKDEFDNQDDSTF